MRTHRVSAGMSKTGNTQTHTQINTLNNTLQKPVNLFKQPTAFHRKTGKCAQVIVKPGSSP